MAGKAKSLEESIVEGVDLGAPPATPTPEVKKTKKKIVLKNVLGQDVEEKDYFYSKTNPGDGTTSESFNQRVGFPVEREDLIEVFNRVFDVKKNVLFYKAADKEVYLVIVPLKYSSSVSRENDSFDGDFQIHSMSFIAEGSVNLDTLRAKLQRILPFLKNTDK